MSYSLAVCVPVLGTPSETFLRRHVEELVPGGTVVIARRPTPDHANAWRTDAPVLWLDDLADEWGGARERAAVADFLSAYGVQVVLAEYLDIWLAFLPTFTSAGVRCVVHAHGYDVSARLTEEYWREAYLAYRDVDAVVTMSTTSRQRLVDLGLPAERLHVVPYGVDLPVTLDAVSADTLHVLLVGRLVGKKAPLATLEACRLAVAAGARLRVTVIGDGPLRAAVEDMTEDLGLPVDLRGAAPHAEVLAAMRTADVFCQHSVTDPETGDEEGLPVAVLEAMAHGLPVVSTRHAGIPEAVQDGVTGLLGDEGDVAGMGRHIAALAADPVMRRRLGDAGRARVEERFSAEAERRALLDVLLPADDRIADVSEEAS